MAETLQSYSLGEKNYFSQFCNLGMGIRSSLEMKSTANFLRVESYTEKYYFQSRSKRKTNKKRKSVDPSEAALKSANSQHLFEFYTD